MKISEKVMVIWSLVYVVGFVYGFLWMSFNLLPEAIYLYFNGIDNTALIVIILWVMYFSVITSFVAIGYDKIKVHYFSLARVQDSTDSEDTTT